MFKISNQSYAVENAVDQLKEQATAIIDSNEKNLIGSNLKILRKQKKMSQQELSDKLETLAIYICRGSISRIEDKSRTVTDIELYGLSKVLGVSIDSLFEYPIE